MPVNDLCVYEGCTSSKSKNPNLTFHRFPKDEAVRMKWIISSNNPNLMLKTEEQMLNVRMCSLHFSRDDFIPYGNKDKRKLRIVALPVVINSALTCLTISNSPSATTSTENTISVSSSGVPDKQKDPVIWRRKKICESTPKERELQRLVKLLRNEIKIKNQKIKRLELRLKKKV